jgi:ATP-dependent RNA helicase DeaD
MLFSATVPDGIQRLSRRFMRNPEYVKLSQDFVGVHEIRHVYYSIPGGQREAELQRIISFENPERAIVFCNTREETGRVAEYLRKQGYDAEAISSDLSQADRERVMAKMRAKNIRFLVATDVAARGIDLENLPCVINYTIPESPEVYIHRTGRTGRAGKHGTAISLIGPAEVGSFYYIKLLYKIKPEERSLPSETEVRSKREGERILHLRAMFADEPGPQMRTLARRLMGAVDGEKVVAGLLGQVLAREEGTVLARLPEAPAAAAPAPSPEPRSYAERDEVERSRREGRGRRDGRDRDRGPRPERSRDDRPRSEDRSPRFDDRVARPDDRGPRPDDRGPRPDDRGPRPDDRGPRPDDRGPRLDDRGPRPDDRGPRPDDRGPRPEDRGPRPEDRGPRLEDRGPRLEDRGPRPEDRGPRLEDRGPRPDDRGPRPDDRGPRPDDRGPRPDDRGPRPDRGPRSDDRGPRGPRPERDHRGDRGRGGRPQRTPSAPGEGKEFWEVWSEEVGRTPGTAGTEAEGAPPAEPAAASVPFGAAAVEGSDSGQARLYLNLGRKDGASEGDVSELLSSEGISVSPADLDVMNTHTYVNVPAADAERVRSALTGKVHNGRALVCEAARPPRRR